MKCPEKETVLVLIDLRSTKTNEDFVLKRSPSSHWSKWWKL